MECAAVHKNNSNHPEPRRGTYIRCHDNSFYKLQAEPEEGILDPSTAVRVTAALLKIRHPEAGFKSAHARRGILYFVSYKKYTISQPESHHSFKLRDDLRLASGLFLS